MLQNVVHAIGGRPSRSRRTTGNRRKTRRARGRKDRSGSSMPKLRERLAMLGRAFSGQNSMSPPAVASLSLLVWGGGQFYTGQRRLGCLFMLVEVLAVSVHWAVVRTWSTLVDLTGSLGVPGWHLVTLLLTLELSLVLFVLAQVFHAYSIAGGTVASTSSPHPLLSGVASLLLPGWGQLLNDQIRKALFFIGSFLTGLFITLLLLFSELTSTLESDNVSRSLVVKVIAGAVGVMVTAVGLSVVSLYDAVVVARARRRTRGDGGSRS